MDLERKVGTDAMDKGKYAVQLLGAVPVGVTPSPKLQSSKRYFDMLDSKAWTVLVKPFCDVPSEVDSTSTIIRFDPLGLEFPDVTQADSVTLTPVKNGKTSYTLMELVTKDKPAQKFVAPSCVDGRELPYVLISGREFTEYMDGMALGMTQLGRRLLSFLRNDAPQQGFFKSMDHAYNRFQELKQTIDSNFTGLKDPMQLDEAKARFPSLNQYIDFFLHDHPLFIERIIPNLNMNSDSLLPVEPMFLKSEHRSIPIYGRKELKKRERSYDFEKNHSHDDFTTAMRGLAAVGTLAAKIGWKYAVSTQDEMDNFLGKMDDLSIVGTRVTTGRIIEVGKQLDPPLSLSELAQASQYAAKLSGKLFYGELAAATFMLLMFAPPIAALVAAYGVGDYCMRVAMHGRTQSESAGFLGTFREFYMNNK